MDPLLSSQPGWVNTCVSWEEEKVLFSMHPSNPDIQGFGSFSFHKTKKPMEDEIRPDQREEALEGTWSFP